MNNLKTKTSSRILPISETCMQCQAKFFSNDESERQEKVSATFGKLPADCVSSPVDGIKCPFKTGKAFVRENITQKIPQHGDGFCKVSSVC